MKAEELLEKYNAGERDFRGVDLQGTDLRGADLEETDLRGADLQGADLQGANLREANLQDSNLREANLFGTDLKGVNLRGADLQGADLEETNLYETNLYGAKYNSKTIFPDGFDPQSQDMVCCDKQEKIKANHIDELAVRHVQVLEENKQLRARFDEQCQIIEEKREEIQKLREQMNHNNHRM